MDESGLFYRSTVSKSFHVKGETCSGGKMSKARLTVSFCASMTGEKESIVVIGKSANPRCFKKVPPSSLPVHYYSNKKAWMTSNIFEDWVKKFDRKMRRQGRKVLLFLDNAPSHPKLTLNNVTLKFLPPNTTSKSQPMDQGIIQAVKLKYRKRQLQHILTNMARHKIMTGSQLLKQISILDAIYWVNRAWNQVETDTIVKCFSAAGFTTPEPVPDQLEDDEEDEETEEDNVPLEVIRLSMDLFGVGFLELADIDRKVSTCDTEAKDWTANSKDLLSDIQATDAEDDDDIEEEEECVEDSTLTTTLSEVQAMVADCETMHSRPAMQGL
ncbi:tigger transposable element-derived protein 4-like [Pecten maximus]|uniref:tigger transposable element-derived protein 4-like n=1 Tax=Pecten maximus TaxID=6579 RepID=UPI0014589767|nr:tigger transposable element-derived protein 4-like [Pecten maximus]